MLEIELGGENNTELMSCTSTTTHLDGLPHTAGSSRQEAWLETVTSGVPFGRFSVA